MYRCDANQCMQITLIRLCECIPVCQTSDMICRCPSPPHVGTPVPSICNVAVVSPAQYVLIVTAAPALHVKAMDKRPGDLHPVRAPGL